MDIFIFGMPRTGTNYLSALVANCTSAHVDRSIHKHTTASSADMQHLRPRGQWRTDPICLIVRHPLLWLESILNHTAHELTSFYSVDLKLEQHSALQLVELYANFYLEWNQALVSHPKHRLFQFESLLETGGTALTSWIDAIGTPPADPFFAPEKLPNSVVFSAKDRLKNTRYQTTLPASLCREVMASISDDFQQLTEYSLEQVEFCSPSDNAARVFLYAFQNDVYVAKRASPEVIDRMLEEYPSSPTAHLAAHIAKQQRPDYENQHLALIPKLTAKQASAFDGRELGAIILNLIYVGENDTAASLLEISQTSGGVLPLDTQLLIRSRLAAATADIGRQEAILRGGLLILPNNKVFAAELATLLCATGRLQDAIEITSAALEQYKDDVWLLGTHAGILFDIGRWLEAEHFYRRTLDCLRTDHAQQSASYGGVVICLARTLLKLGDRPQAFSLLDSVGDNYPHQDWYKQQIEQIRSS